MQPTKFYIGVIGFFLAALVFGGMFFLTGMGDSSYLISDGIAYGVHYIDKPRYDSNMQGFIFVLSFLGAGLLLCLLVILPDRQALAAQTQAVQAQAAPQPRRRPAAPQAQTAPQPAPQAAPQPPPPLAAAAPAAEQAPEPEAGPPPTVEIESESAAAKAPAPSPPAPPPEPSRSVEEEVLTDTPLPEFSIDDVPDSRYEDTGDEDVVYGNGRVTDDSVWEFIQSYPDSAVKFLYRKSLENKALSPTEEDIYRRWEMRGMTRSGVRKFVLEMMGWASLPDDFPHNIWRLLRDQIFEMKTRAS